MPRKPLSPARIAANRANAARSTGPRTPEGKARSSQNARKHGFTASSFAVVRLEDLDEIAHLKDDLVAVYQPVNSQELFAIERIAIAQQGLLRAARLESGLLTYCLDEALDRTTGDLFTPMQPALAGDGDIEITRAQNRNLAAATGFHKMAMASNTWSLFLRYQAQAERHYRRAIEEFERLKALRPIEPNSGTQAERNEEVPLPETNPSHTTPAGGLPVPASGSQPESPKVPGGQPSLPSQFPRAVASSPTPALTYRSRCASTRKPPGAEVRPPSLNRPLSSQRRFGNADTSDSTGATLGSRPFLAHFVISCGTYSAS